MTWLRVLGLVASGVLASCRSPDVPAPSETAPPGEWDGEAGANGSDWKPLPHWILVDELENARDVGGVPLSGGASVAHGALFRGPPLASLTAAGCEEFGRLGIRTVIDLRVDTERETAPEAGCVADAVHVVSAPLPVPYSVSTADYIADLKTFDSIAIAFQELGDPAAYPIYVHCTWGRDRTGVLTAVILRALGASRADILKEYLLSAASVGAYPASLAGMLNEIEAQGGIEAYLANAGIQPEQVDAMHSVLRASEPGF